MHEKSIHSHLSLRFFDGDSLTKIVLCRQIHRLGSRDSEDSGGYVTRCCQNSGGGGGGRVGVGREAGVYEFGFNCSLFCLFF